MEYLFTKETPQAKTLARTKDPETSKDAAVMMVESGALSRQEEDVYNAILWYTLAENDFTTKDIAHHMQTNVYSYDKCYDICRKRFSGLAAKGKIEVVQYKYSNTEWTFVYKDARRDGCRVWRLK